MRLIDADALKRKMQKVATKAWKMKLNASIEKTFNQCIDYIDSAPTIEPKQGEWIPCSERLPEIGMKTILLYDSEEISGGTYIGNLAWNAAFASKNEFVKVIAWMPLPEPWKGTDDE